MLVGEEEVGSGGIQHLRFRILQNTTVQKNNKKHVRKKHSTEGSASGKSYRIQG